ncbi:MAG TPA: hypothetical protein VHE35_01825 [Kofleriaceae bacterium]|nr:hypothetical protein [Kofleriaceae bacterium]
MTDNLSDPAGIPALVEAIKHTHGVDATWLEAAPVVETFRGATVWSGVVQIFQVTHPSGATRCYAWSHAVETPGRRRFIVVLGAGPVVDPTVAVRVALAAEARRR